MQIKVASVEEYISNAPGEVQDLLKKIRAVIHKAAPDADEAISYGMPAFSIQGKPLVYFAAFKNHIGFYATPSGHTAFEKELSKYKQGKGSVQFPLDKPIPFSLITKIVKFRLKEVKEKLKTKKK
ncbi:MAG: DUF1801 domain-containing protein [Agriterribacter sp.]|nr:MAG: hypothetical protein BGP13_03525 [Sphingobacteriales bacterium 40-81]